jgi:hypothetical protein
MEELKPYMNKLGIKDVKIVYNPRIRTQIIRDHKGYRIESPDLKDTRGLVHELCHLYLAKNIHPLFAESPLILLEGQKREDLIEKGERFACCCNFACDVWVDDCFVDNFGKSMIQEGYSKAVNQLPSDISKMSRLNDINKAYLPYRLGYYMASVQRRGLNLDFKYIEQAMKDEYSANLAIARQLAPILANQPLLPRETKSAINALEDSVLNLCSEVEGINVKLIEYNTGIGYGWCFTKP